MDFFSTRGSKIEELAPLLHHSYHHSYDVVAVPFFTRALSSLINQHSSQTSFPFQQQVFNFLCNVFFFQMSLISVAVRWPFALMVLLALRLPPKSLASPAFAAKE